MEIEDIKKQPIDETTLRNDPFAYPPSEQPTPYAVYAALFAVFGAPNSVVQRAGQQWSYELATPKAAIRISDWKHYAWRLEIFPHDHTRATADELYAELIKLFEKHIQEHEDTYAQEAKASPLTIVQNPYRIYFDSAEELLELAEESHNSAQAKKLCRSAFFMYLSAFEGLLNLIYDLYLRPTVATDKDALRRAIEAPVDSKIAMAPIYCLCFTKDVLDIDAEVYKRYKAVRALRNKFIHANLNDTMRTPVIRRDGMVFPYMPAAKANGAELPTMISELRPEHLRMVRTTIDAMHKEIVKAMNAHQRHNFARAMESEEIIIDRTNGSTAIRFEF